MPSKRQRVRRAPGWIRLAGIALELGALAFIAYVLTGDSDAGVPPRDDRRREHVDRPEPAARPARTVARTADPYAFIAEAGDQGASYYRAADETVELIAGFYSDGRVRLADRLNRRFAGMLQGSHADLLDVDSNQWGELFVLHTPGGGMQLELRGGPYDARVLTCEPVQNNRLSTTSG